MRLRVTTEAPTYAFATSPVNFGGLTQEDLLFFIVPLVIVSKTTGENLWAFAVAFFCLWLFKRSTRNKPQGFLALMASTFVGDLYVMTSEFPALQKAVGKFGRFTARIWLEIGLTPSPSYCNRYEP